jgi:hypothetical protein
MPEQRTGSRPRRPSAGISLGRGAAVVAEHLIGTPPTSGPAGVRGSVLTDRRAFLRTVGPGNRHAGRRRNSGCHLEHHLRGVFATGSGPAYAAWDELIPLTRDPIALVRAAILAANARNAQPWHFALTPNRNDAFADPTRTLGAMDPLLREMYLSLGCALENLVLARPPNGYATTVTPCPTRPTAATSRALTSPLPPLRHRRCSRPSRTAH